MSNTDEAQEVTSKLKDLAQGDAAKFRKYAALFLQSFEEVLGHMESACISGDMTVLAAMGHRAKSTAMTVGAIALSERCIALEQASCAGDSIKATQLAQQVASLFQGIRTAVKEAA